MEQKKDMENDISSSKKKKLLVAGIIAVLVAVISFVLIMTGVLPIAGLSQGKQDTIKTENSQQTDETENSKEPEEEEILIADTARVYDIYDLTEAFVDGVEKASYKNLGILETDTNVAIKLRVTVTYTNAEYIFGIAKEKTDHPWTKTGYMIQFCPEKKTIEIKTNKSKTVAKLTDLIISNEYILEYGVVDMRNEAGEVVARKVYVKLNDAEVLSYLDKDLEHPIGTYAPVYAGAGTSLIFNSCVYEFKGKEPLVHDIKTLFGGVSAKELNPGFNYLGELSQSTNVAVRAKVYIHNYHESQGFVEKVHSNGFKIGLSRVADKSFWSEPYSGYQVWIRPKWSDIGYGFDSWGCARRDYEAPQEFVLEVGTYDVDMLKNGHVLKKNYARKVYVKVDGKEIMSWLDYDDTRLFGKHVVFYAEGQVKMTFMSASN